MNWKQNWGYRIEKDKIIIAEMFDDRLTISLVSFEDGYLEPFSGLTVNIDAPAPDYCGHLDTNNISNVEKFVAENGLGEFTGLTGRSGYNEPVYKDVCNPITSEFRKELYEDILSLYEEMEQTGRSEVIREVEEAEEPEIIGWGVSEAYFGNGYYEEGMAFGDCAYLNVKSRENWWLGDSVVFENASYQLYEKQIIFHQGELKFICRFGRPGILYKKRTLNPYLAGVSLV